MILNIGKHDCTELWDGVLYKALSGYPNVTDNEMKDILDFIAYEKMYEREVEIVCDNPKIYTYVMKESRNAANDPADFFHYVMFAWGNCQAGDRLVMERKLKHNPTEEDLSINFTPGIRFYFKYEVLENHPKAMHDGFLPIKVKDEVVLAEYVYAIIIPVEYRRIFEIITPDILEGKVYYLNNDCRDIWEWSEKVYSFVAAL